MSNEQNTHYLNYKDIDENLPTIGLRIQVRNVDEQNPHIIFKIEKESDIRDLKNLVGLMPMKHWIAFENKKKLFKANKIKDEQGYLIVSHTKAEETIMVNLRVYDNYYVRIENFSTIDYLKKTLLFVDDLEKSMFAKSDTFVEIEDVDFPNVPSENSKMLESFQKSIRLSRSNFDHKSINLVKIANGEIAIQTSGIDLNNAIDIEMMVDLKKQLAILQDEKRCELCMLNEVSQLKREKSGLNNENQGLLDKEKGFEEQLALMKQENDELKLTIKTHQDDLSSVTQLVVDQQHENTELKTKSDNLENDQTDLQSAKIKRSEFFNEESETLEMKIANLKSTLQNKTENNNEMLEQISALKLQYQQNIENKYDQAKEENESELLQKDKLLAMRDQNIKETQVEMQKLNVDISNLAKDLECATNEKIATVLQVEDLSAKKKLDQEKINKLVQENETLNQQAFEMDEKQQALTYNTNKLDSELKTNESLNKERLEEIENLKNKLNNLQEEIESNGDMNRLQVTERKADKEQIVNYEKKIEDMRKQKAILMGQLEEQASTKNNQLRSIIFKKEQAEKKIAILDDDLLGVADKNTDLKKENEDLKNKEQTLMKKVEEQNQNLKNKDVELEAVKSQIGEKVVLLGRHIEKTKKEQEKVIFLNTELESINTKLYYLNFRKDEMVTTAVTLKKNNDEKEENYKKQIEQYKLQETKHLSVQQVSDKRLETKDQEIQDFKAETEKNDDVIKKLETEIAEYHEKLNKKTVECEALVYKIKLAAQSKKSDNEKFEEQQRKIDETCQRNNDLQSKLDKKDQDTLELKIDRSMLRNQVQDNNSSELHEVVNELESQKNHLTYEKIELQNKIAKLDTDIKKTNSHNTVLLQKSEDDQTEIINLQTEAKNSVQKILFFEEKNQKLEQKLGNHDKIVLKLNQEIVALKNQLQDLNTIKKRNEDVESEKLILQFQIEEKVLVINDLISQNKSLQVIYGEQNNKDKKDSDFNFKDIAKSFREDFGVELHEHKLSGLQIHNSKKDSTHHFEHKPNGDNIIYEYHNNGEIKKQYQMKNGSKHGTVQWFDQTGILLGFYNYQNGKRQGSAKEWYQNGKKKFDGQFINNMITGPCKIYRDDGKLNYDGKFLDGERHGKGISFDRLGELKYDGEWKYGKMHGYGKLYDNGKFRYEGVFENGVPLSNKRDNFDDHHRNY